MRCLTDELVTKAEIQTENGEIWVLDYFLQTTEGENGEEFYGLRIDKSTPDGELCEREETPALTNSRDNALALLNAFARGTVPPVTLLEMTDEWLGEILPA